MTKFVQQLKTFGVLWRHMTSIAVVLAALWAFSGPFVKSYAADAFVEMLIEQGVDPKTFSEIEKRSIAQDKSLDELSRDFNTLKNEVGKLGGKIEAQTIQGDKIENLVQRLLELQLRRAAQP